MLLILYEKLKEKTHHRCHVPHEIRGCPPDLIIANRSNGDSGFYKNQ